MVPFRDHNWSMVDEKQETTRIAKDNAILQRYNGGGESLLFLRVNRINWIWKIFPQIRLSIKE